MRWRRQPAACRALLIVTPARRRARAGRSRCASCRRPTCVQHDAAGANAWTPGCASAARLALVLAVLLGLGALLVVGNTVRLDIQSRREEIGVLQLLGASDGFIRRPFLYLGAWYGLAAGAAGAGVLTGWPGLALRAPLAELAAQLWQPFRAARAGSAAGLAGPAGRRRGAGLAGRRPGHRPLPAPDPADRDLSMACARQDLRHVVSDAPRVMVVDGSQAGAQADRRRAAARRCRMPRWSAAQAWPRRARRWRRAGRPGHHRAAAARRRRHGAGARWCAKPAARPTCR